MTRWRLDVGPAGQRPTHPLSTAATRSFTFNLSEPSTATFTIDARSADGQRIEELATDVHLLRDGVPLYTGRVLSTADSIDDTAHTLTVSCTDLRGVLARRHTRTRRDWTKGVPAGRAVRDLLREAQAAPYTSLGFDVPDFTDGATVERDVLAGQSILGELQALAGGVEGGSSVFDWDVSPGWRDRTAQLWAPTRGRDLTGPGGLTLQYRQARPGARTPAFGTISRGFDPATYANVLTLTGGSRRVPRTTVDPSTGETVIEVIDVPTEPVTLTDSDAITALGAWSAAEAYPDLTTQAEVRTKARQRFDELRRTAASWTFPLRLGLWQGPRTLWLGDTVRVVVTSGRLREDLALRVTQLTLALDSTGREQVAVTAGPPPRDYLTELVAAKRRLAALEQH
ncbi:hypothetical protein GCM10027586_00720 [Kineococcus gypseus]|uniref:hypothetical protein n=1 Tax=Kineococcus gypseus TaxID=1637102 RepID=UPI003D7DBF13